MTNPWAQLNENSVITRVQEVTGKELNGLFLKRNSYINRVFELEEESPRSRLIAKFYRPGRWTKEQILEEHAFVNELRSLDNHVIAPLEFSGNTLFQMNGGIHFAVYEKKGGRAVDEFDKEGWQNIGQLIGKMHRAGTKGGNGSSSKRIVWSPESATKHHVEVVIGSNTLPEEFKAPFLRTMELLIGTASPCFVKSKQIRLHGDVHRGNLIHRPGEGTFIVDFDDMCMGPAVQDMWMLLPDKVENSQSEISWFIDGYRVFMDFDTAELLLINYLQAMRMVHYAAWCAIQKDDPGFEGNFPEWGTKKYWGQLIRDINSLLASEES